MTKGAFAVIQKANRVLLVKPPNWVLQYSGHWNFPGGVVNDGESLQAAARREALEETNIVGEIKELLATHHDKKHDTTVFIFRAEYVSGEIKIQESEISEAKWFTVKDALEQKLAFDIRKALLKLQ